MRRTATSTLLSILLLASPGLSTVSAGETRSPVPLKVPPLIPPLEAAGTGLAPEVSVRITLDDRGKVTAVEVLAIEPSNEYDAHFEKAVRDALMEWRYAPAMEDGEPVETVLEWKVAFLTREEQAEEPDVTNWFRMTTRRPLDDQERHLQILTMPEEARLRFLEQEATFAEKYLDPRNRRRHGSPRFIAVTDAHSQEAVQGLSNNLEVTFNILADLLTDTVQPQPEQYKVLAYMFAYQTAFRNFSGHVKNYDWSAGFYHPTGLLAFHMQMPSNDSLVGLMLHEATHAYLDRYVTRPGILLPMWLNEGLAQYVGSSRIKNGELIPGKTRRRERYRLSMGGRWTRSQPLSSLGDVKKAIRMKKDLPLEKVIIADRQTFYADDRESYYAMSWLLVHYLRHGKPGWESEQFPNLVLYLAEGYPSREVLETVYRTDLETMQAELRKYIMRF